VGNFCQLTKPLILSLFLSTTAVSDTYLDKTLKDLWKHVTADNHVGQLITAGHASNRCEDGNDIPPDTPPPPRPTDRSPNDWTPYNNHVEFEVADFLYRRNQISSSDANFIFHLWATSLAAHNDTPPFTNHTEMYETINSTLTAMTSLGRALLWSTMGSGLRVTFLCG
jgi:hypothetical protein